MNSNAIGTAPRLKGVDHTARPTWKLKETVEFYRDKLGLPLIHTISARGWGPETHPDFLHFFFDSGNGSTIAFFYYLGSKEPDHLTGKPGQPPVPSDHVFDATHTSWLVDTKEELLAWKARLESNGVDVSTTTAHEVIESIYFRDPNGYFIEITRKLRPVEALDGRDAALTLEAAIRLEEEAKARGASVQLIDSVWNKKASLLDAETGRTMASSGAAVRIYVLNVPEFAAIVDAARRQAHCTVTQAGKDYLVIEAREPVEFGRKALNLKPAVWYGLFTGGLRGKIERFDRDIVRIVPA
ncbi:Catechol 2,3-dioxygenase [Noviherbaspirillum humi]|uniref:Catechol 2,3-dioxygenase n=1 Tax=Noviherbaspirillum humi TaxID=1688639 RepID=A0A239JV77_9BURK|nr:VOC family protein [Noviherbaspirillum humi]SNT09452.1 Catechol 2,3-dioxygenase [Noviherbaspirillum humi]